MITSFEWIEWARAGSNGALELHSSLVEVLNWTLRLRLGGATGSLVGFVGRLSALRISLLLLGATGFLSTAGLTLVLFWA